MSPLELLAIAVALSMDALAVSVTTGVALRRPSAGQLIRMPAAFGIFQALMPLLGYALGAGCRQFIEQWDHWVAALLLFFVGAKLLRDSLAGDGEDPSRADPTAGLTLLMLALATSIDAMAVGFSFALLDRPILLPALVIGLVCAGISLAGLLAGCRIGRLEALRRWSGVAGALALFLIALLILHDHGVF